MLEIVVSPPSWYVTRPCLPNCMESSPNAVWLNGVGHDGDGPNAASPDASTHNFRAVTLTAGRLPWLVATAAEERLSNPPQLLLRLLPLLRKNKSRTLGGETAGLHTRTPPERGVQERLCLGGVSRALRRHSGKGGLRHLS